MQPPIEQLLAERHGHFVFESGHHGDVWLALELLFLNPERVRPLADELAQQIQRADPEVICGPLEEGALLAMLIALQLQLPFCYSIPKRADTSAQYRLPDLQTGFLANKKVALVDDVINAGSAIGGTIDALTQCDAMPVAIGALVTYGSSAATIADRYSVTLSTLVSKPSRIWDAATCPLCADNVPIDNRANVS